jgi:uncharacterized membrane protein YkoI
MKTLKTLLLVTSVAALAACASSKPLHSDSSSSQSGGVPANILAAAKSSVPGFAMTSYDTDTDNGRMVYDLDGTAKGRQCEVKVDANGKVLKIDRD